MILILFRWEFLAGKIPGGLVPSVLEGESATAKRCVGLDYTFWLNLVAPGLSAFLYRVYRMGLGGS